MDKFYIIANSDKDKDGSISREISDYIMKNGKTCLVKGESEPEGDVDCILVLGGDGTLLRAAREVVDFNIPLLGINLGTLGYLAEIDRNSIFPALDSLFADEYTLETRMMIKGTVYHEGQQVYSDIALNDIVISREGPLRVVQFKNYVNGEFLNEYQADGIIVSTPTGSTGYSLSAGGPIISPQASLLVMTPLAPHTLNARSVVFPPEDRITVEIGQGRMEQTEVASVSFDGSVHEPMVTGDLIVVQRSSKDIRLVKINNISFLEVLRTKLSNE